MKKSISLAALALLGAGAASLALRSPMQSATAKPMAQGVTQGTTQGVIIGQKIAPLQLRDTSGKPVTITKWNKSKATVLMFVATKCPVSNAYNTRMASLGKTFAPKGVRFVGINSNKAEMGAEVAAHTKSNGFNFAVYKDPQNVIADRLAAKVTPEVFVIGSKGELLYHGRIDNSQNEAEVNDKSLALALDAILSGKSVAAGETRAFGCSIKRAE